MYRRALATAAFLLWPSLGRAIICPKNMVWINRKGGTFCVKDQLPALVKTIETAKSAMPFGAGDSMYGGTIAGLKKQGEKYVLNEKGEWVARDGSLDTPAPLPEDVRRAVARANGKDIEPDTPARTDKPQDAATPPADGEKTAPSVSAPAAPPPGQTAPSQAQPDSPVSAPPANAGPEQPVVLDQGAAKSLSDWTNRSESAGGGGPTTQKAADLNGPDSTTSKVGASGAVKSLGGRLKGAFNDAAKLNAGDFAGTANKMGALGPGAKADSSLGRGSAESKAGAAPGLSDPKTMQEFVLAAGPYKDSFARAGLRAAVGANGEPQVLAKDGRPASPAQLSALGDMIRREPSALARNPNYFDPGRGGISREEYGGLKTAYKDKPELHDKDFKDVELKDDKDFKQSRSCDVVSGDCNAHADKSYAKDDDVPPGELKKIWDAIEGYAADAEQHLEEPEEAPKAEKNIGGSLRLRSSIDALGSPRSAGGAVAGAIAAGWRWLTGAPTKEAPKAPAAAKSRSAQTPAMAAAISETGPIRRRPLALLALLLAAGAGAAVLRRRRAAIQEVKGE